LAPYLAAFDLPSNSLNKKDSERYYSFDEGNAHFIALDTNDPLIEVSEDKSDDMLDWLESDLERHKNMMWKIVFFHHPPYTSGIEHGPDMRVRQHLVPIFDKYNVDIVFSGHEHNYERTCALRNDHCEESGTTYFVTGGGGATPYGFGPSEYFSKSKFSDYHFILVNKESCKLDIKAIGVNNQVLDIFKMSKCYD
jgi:hypothetical protein